MAKPTIPPSRKPSRVALRERLHQILRPYEAAPDQPRLSLYLDLFIFFCIIASCVVVAIEYAGEDTHTLGQRQALMMAELIFTAIFTVEYLVRWYASPSRLRYPVGFYAIVDLVAVLPSLLMFVEVWAAGSGFLAVRAVRGMRILRLARLLRLLRLLKLLQHGYWIFRFLTNARIWARTVIHQYRLGRLGKLLVGVMAAWIVGSNLVYATEYLSTDEGAGSAYADNYWRGYWNIIIVLISGMDAEAPVSLGGRVLITILLIAGICVVGVLTGEIVSILVRSSQRTGRMKLKPPDLRLSQHIVILGRNEHLENIIAQVHAALSGHHYLLVVCPGADELPSSGAETHKRVFALPGDPLREDVLTAANVENALRVIVLSGGHVDQPGRDRDNAALMRALAAVARNRSVPLVVELHEPESLRYASAIQNAECVVSRHFGELLISQAVLSPGVTEIYSGLMTFTGDTNEFYRVPVPKRLVGKTFAAAQERFLEQDDETIVLVGIDDGSSRAPYDRFQLCVEGASEDPALGDHVLAAEDRLIVMAYERPHFAALKQEELWSGKVLARG